MGPAGRLARPLALCLLLLLAACATTPKPGPAPGPTPHRPPPVAGVSPATLPGWNEEDHLAALAAYRAGCGADRDPTHREACEAARALRNADGAQARRFLEARFRAVPVTGGPELLTAYFAPEYEARREPDEIFSAPVRPRPPGLVRGADGKFPPWLTRREIETLQEDETQPALAWMRPEDLFFMQIQGSGYLSFPDGGAARAAYAADNGQPFTGIARPMVERGLLPSNGTSGEAIRAWLAERRGAEAQAITDLNPRYVFFALEPDDHGQPRGAANIALPAGRAIAVDPAFHAYGELYFLDADGGSLSGAAASYRRLAVALDTGGAIKGPVRADLYMGRGQAAGAEAGRVKHPLRMWKLEPIP